jgi:hypothetical protein
MTGSCSCFPQRDRPVLQRPVGCSARWRIRSRAHGCAFTPSGSTCTRTIRVNGGRTKSWPTHASATTGMVNARSGDSTFNCCRPSGRSERRKRYYRKPTQCGTRSSCTRAARSGRISLPKSPVGGHRSFEHPTVLRISCSAEQVVERLPTPVAPRDHQLCDHRESAWSSAIWSGLERNPEPDCFEQPAGIEGVQRVSARYPIEGYH